MQKDIKLSPKTLKLTIIAFFSAILLISLIGISYNIYQEKATQLTLTNYSRFLNKKYRKEIQTTLLNVLSKSTKIKPIFAKGYIREDSFTALTDQGITTAAFLVDIDEFKQTFLVSYSFPEQPLSASSETVATYRSASSSANTILVSCPPKEKRKYPDSSCVSMYNTSAELDALADQGNLINQLPIVIDDFDFASRTAIHYEILGHLNGENQFIITINDFSGGNYSAALSQLAPLGVTEETHKILYYDLSH